MRTAHSALGFEGCWGCWGVVGRCGALRLRCSAGMLRLLLSSVCDDAGIGLDFGGSQVGVVCWGCRCGGFVWSNE